ncbi:MAG: hypothetical protein HUJ72_01725, partial [Blautia sp.]|nr:hypothetical protein [Blautia sp.]
MIDKGAYKPEKAYDTDAGFDIRTPEEFDLWPGESATIKTGVHVQIPRGYTGFLKSKSGLNVHYGITGDGVIDCGYTGEIAAKLYRHKFNQSGPCRFHAGDKISQLVLARLIRPCIGLTTRQTSAAKKYYDKQLEEQRKEHPQSKDSVLQQRALDKTLKYSERAHRQRAMTIAQKELAKAYNYGADESIRTAQNNFLVGKCIKRWNTSGDENVCGQCNDLDGKEVGMEETFYDGNKIVEDGMYPPLHPLCACAIQYI